MRFADDVIEASRESPILVDFWAEWCGPCRTLTPVLEDLEGESGGAWRLVKINVDQEPEIARQFRIASIPTVMLFVDGTPIAEFMGSLPKADLRKWLAQHLPDPDKEELQAAKANCQKGDDSTATQILEALVARRPDWDDAVVELAVLLAWRDPIRADQLLQHLDSRSPLFDRVTHIRQVTSFYPFSVGDEPSAIEALLNRAHEALFRGALTDAVESLISSIHGDKHFADDLARKLCIALFQLYGPCQPELMKWRKRFEMSLF
ncbi:MAG: thioredoxin [Acidobacteria bacterium]|nr:thioredoxin [Acidobacteriota bacterium]